MKESIDLTLDESGEMVAALISWLRDLEKINDQFNDGSADRQINAVKSLLVKLGPTWNKGIDSVMFGLEYDVLLNFKPTNNLLYIEIK